MIRNLPQLFCGGTMIICMLDFCFPTTPPKLQVLLKKFGLVELQLSLIMISFKLIVTFRTADDRDLHDNNFTGPIPDISALFHLHEL
jgi:hypothetical protein